MDILWPAWHIYFLIDVGSTVIFTTLLNKWKTDFIFEHAVILYIWSMFLLISKHKLRPLRIPAIKTCRRRGDQGYKPCLNRDSVCAHKSSFIGTLSVVIIYELELTGFTVWITWSHTHSADNILKRNWSSRRPAHTLMSTHCAMKSTFHFKINAKKDVHDNSLSMSHIMDMTMLICLALADQICNTAADIIAAFGYYCYYWLFLLLLWSKYDEGGEVILIQRYEEHKKKMMQSDK